MQRWGKEQRCDRSWAAVTSCVGKGKKTASLGKGGGEVMWIS